MAQDFDNALKDAILRAGDPDAPDGPEVDPLLAKFVCGNPPVTAKHELAMAAAMPIPGISDEGAEYTGDSADSRRYDPPVGTPVAHHYKYPRRVGR
jgi:hypothetical protein